MIFGILSSVSLYIGILFCGLCLATGLYYLSELAEQYSLKTKKILMYCGYGVILMHVLLFIFDRFSFFPIFIGILSHVVYLKLINSFPFVSLKSIWSILSIGLFFFSHFVWFRFFTERYYTQHSFHQLMGFFTTMIWLVPGGFFVTLSINETHLPGQNQDLRNPNVTPGFGNGKPGNLIQWLFSFMPGRKYELSAPKLR